MDEEEEEEEEETTPVAARPPARPPMRPIEAAAAELGAVTAAAAVLLLLGVLAWLEEDILPSIRPPVILPSLRPPDPDVDDDDTEDDEDEDEDEDAEPGVEVEDDTTAGLISAVTPSVSSCRGSVPSACEVCASLLKTDATEDADAACVRAPGVTKQVSVTGEATRAVGGGGGQRNDTTLEEGPGG